MSTQKGDSHREILARLFQKPGFRREYLKEKPYSSLLVQIIERRNELGLSQRELARKLGSHQSAISRLESGSHRISFDTLIDVADALDTYVDIRLIPYQKFEGWQEVLPLRIESPEAPYATTTINIMYEPAKQ